MSTSKQSPSSQGPEEPGLSSSLRPTKDITPAGVLKAKEASKPAKPRVNNIAHHPSRFCCGMTEIGNFNYVDPEGGKKMTHYHSINGSWASQPNADYTTKEDVLERIKYLTSGNLICSTGAGQEYMDPILEEIGFRHVFTFVNPGHAQTPVKIWCYSKTEVK